MNRKKNKIYCLLFIMIFSVTASIAQQNSKPEIISYKQYIDTVNQQLPEIRRNRLQVEKARNTLYGAGSAEDFYLSGEAGYAKTDILNSQNQRSAGERIDYSTRLGVTKKIAATGTTINAGAAYNKTEFNNLAYYYPSIYIKFNQALLNNSFGKVDRYAVNNARFGYEIEKLREQENNKADMNYYRKLYFTWIFYKEELKLIESSISAAKKLADNIKNRFRSGMVNSADLYNSSAFVLNYEITYEDLLRNINIIEAELNIVLGDIKERNISPDNNEFHQLYANSANAAYSNIVFERTRNAEIFRLTKDNLKYTAEVADNQLLPQLDLVGEYTRKAENREAVKSMGDMKSSDYYLGVALSYPLENTDSRSKAESAKIAIEEVNSEYAILKNSYQKSLESIIIQYTDVSRILSLREKRVEALEQKYKFDSQRYQQSQIDLDILLNTTIDITNEKITLLQLKKQIIDNYIDYSDITEGIE
ncbi:MAG: TolC family protein [Leptospirales bacterium]|nr:TolC family protein [Leptospirales bacterium]